MKIRLDIEGKDAGSLNYKGPESVELAVSYLNSLDADEVQVHLSRDDGTKVDAEFEGEIPALSAARFIMSVVKTEPLLNSRDSSQAINESGTLTLKERLEMFLRFEYKGKWFSSIDVKRQYENVYGRIGLSTVSTYLARMYREDLLNRRGNRSQREYCFKEPENFVHRMEMGLAT